MGKLPLHVRLVSGSTGRKVNYDLEVLEVSADAERLADSTWPPDTEPSLGSDVVPTREAVFGFLLVGG